MLRHVEISMRFVGLPDPRLSALKCCALVRLGASSLQAQVVAAATLSNGSGRI